MRILLLLPLMACLSFSYLTAEENADTIYFVSGRNISGIISREGKDTVELETEGGPVVISRSEIKDIHHASAEALAALKAGWAERRANLKSRERVFEEDREKRFKAYGDWIDETRRRTAQVREEGEAAIKNDPESRNILVDAILNGDVKALLIVDTGASIIVLSKSVGDKMGLDLSADKGDITELRLAGGQSVKAKAVVLKSVNIDGVEEKNVPAAVLLEDKGEVGFKDGLLGRSFLGRFNIKIDLQRMKMVMQKLN